MNHHFAASWLQSLAGKLESLTSWSLTANRQNSQGTHRNLFREFFSAQFQKVLALVEEQKKTEFLGVIEKNLHKFDEATQQFPLGCLCALLQHGKDASVTQDKVVAWVDFLLERLRARAWEDRSVLEVLEECLSPAFQKFMPLLSPSLRARLADGLGEHLQRVEEAEQRKALEKLEILPARIEEVVAQCTQDLNRWLDDAPRFPATPFTLAETLRRLEHPLVRFFTVVKDAAKKEAFLVAVALALQGLRTRFRWMCAVELTLEHVGKELQRRFFTVEGQGPVMELWLSSRLRRYNEEVASRTAGLLQAEPNRLEVLRERLRTHFPERAEGDPESGWLSLDGPSALGGAVLSWLAESCPGFFCPHHTLSKETILGLLQRFGRSFEADLAGGRARLGPVGGADQPPPPPKQMPTALAAVPGAAISTVALPSQVAPMLVPPPLTMPGSSLALALPGSGSVPPRPSLAMVPAMVPPPTKPPPPTTPPPEVDNLIDLLLNESLEGVPGELRAKVVKVGHGVYRIATKEVTLHTQNGRLFVNRVGETLRHIPFQTLLQEEGVLPAAPGGLSASVVSSGVADTSSVARIALQAKQISAGVTTTTTSTPQPPAPFLSNRPSLEQAKPQTDPQALMSKRVEAATKAMDVSKQIVRRSVNFDDDKLLRRLLAKGLKHDKQWQSSYQEYCTARGVVSEHDQKLQDKDFIATFIEQNLASSINQEWAKKIIWSQPSDAGEKKEKKEKKAKKERKKQRKGGSSSGSEDDAGGASGAGALVPMGHAGGSMDAGPPMGAMPAFMAGVPGMAMGGAHMGGPMMGHHMGGHLGPHMAGGMMGPMGLPPMMGDAMGAMGTMPPMMDPGDLERARKRGRTEKPEKAEKAKKEKGEKAGKSKR